MTTSLRASRVFWLVLIGTLLIQAAWILVVPPFRGIDEHEHVFKAAAVARGDYSPEHVPAPSGWGEYVAVPRGIVEAATPECSRLPYTTAENCEPGTDRGNGNVNVASSAARYSPVYYAIVGTAALPFDSYPALYAMRAFTALMCAVLLAAAAAVTSRWARTVWPYVALGLGVTPVLLYSTTIVAPNGVEMTAAALVWSTFLGALRSATDDRRASRFIMAATLAAVPLVTVRTMGPLWLLLILVSIATVATPEERNAVVRLRAFRPSVFVIGTAVALSAAWTLTARSNFTPPAERGFDGSVLSRLPQEWLLWWFQSIAAFPSRDEAAPIQLYAIALAAYAALLLVALRHAQQRQRRALLLVVVLGSAVPLVATIATYSSVGTVWQGRYGLPLTVGFFLVCGYAADQARSETRTVHSGAVVITAAVSGAIHAIGQVNVHRTVLEHSPLADTSHWISAPTPLIAMLTAAGAALPWAALLMASRKSATGRPGAQQGTATPIATAPHGQTS